MNAQYVTKEPTVQPLTPSGERMESALMNKPLLTALNTIKTNNPQFVLNVTREQIQLVWDSVYHLITNNVQTTHYLKKEVLLTASNIYQPLQEPLLNVKHVELYKMLIHMFWLLTKQRKNLNANKYLIVRLLFFKDQVFQQPKKSINVLNAQKCSELDLLFI